MVRLQIQAENSAVLILEIRGRAMANPRPYVAAFLCERVLQEKDEVISALRIIDQIKYQPDSLPQGVKPLINFQSLIMFKSGPATGEHEVKIVIENPRGIRKDAYTLPVMLKGQDHGQNLIINMGLGVEQDGLYWIDVVFDGDVLTRIPVKITAISQE